MSRLNYSLRSRKDLSSLESISNDRLQTGHISSEYGSNYLWNGVTKQIFPYTIFNVRICARINRLTYYHTTYHTNKFYLCECTAYDQVTRSAVLSYVIDHVCLIWQLNKALENRIRDGAYFILVSVSKEEKDRATVYWWLQALLVIPSEHMRSGLHLNPTTWKVWKFEKKG